MPVKFRLYQASAIYLLLWSTGFFVWALFEVAADGAGDEPAILFLVFTALALLAVKSVASLRVTRHYKQTTLPGRTEKAFFIIMFCCNALFAVCALLVSIFVIVPEDFGNRFRESPFPNTQEFLLDAGFFIATITSIYLGITDFILLKALRLKHEESLLSFEFETMLETKP